ncbi:MAG: phosphoenolpyruvate carboxykinase (ATP) [Pseudomonadota bacterium]
MTKYLKIASPAQSHARDLGSDFHLTNHGLVELKRAYWNLSEEALYEEFVFRGEGHIVNRGPMLVETGQWTARAAQDKFVVREHETEDRVWWGEYNRPLAPEKFTNLFARVQSYLQGEEVFVQDLYCGQDPEHRLAVRIITQDAWQSLFARNMFITPQSRQEYKDFVPDFTLIAVPHFKCDPRIDGTRTATAMVINFAERKALVCGSEYGGEIKKTIFTVMNFLGPLDGVLSMHCSANVDFELESPALFFGLSGTGKTTLSADPRRKLIGDDEHGWSDTGVFNFEGGCYAKVIRLSPEAEPEIYATTRRFGTILENVGMDQGTRRLDLTDDSLTENTRAAYPLGHIDNSVPSGCGGHPRHVILLTCDAFGVLPPVSKLSPEQASYHFLVGYTAKVAGTERGATGGGPKATFSTCFGAPFMALHPSIYAELLSQRIRNKDAQCWLLNTGWTGGPHGVGSRISIAHTRTLVNAILSGELAKVETVEDPIFGLQVPKSCAGVPEDLLTPRTTWKDPAAYERTARTLAASIAKAFTPFAEKAGAAIAAAGPRVE